jgi:NhaP-type Na+/H+ or K+/H+ antiporter
MHGTGSIFDNASLSVGLALAVGMLAQALARHLRVPGIVLLLGAGVLLGPDVLDVVRPATLGVGLPALVGFAVAVILFEGGMNLNVRRLRREARSIRQLVTLGALVTLIGGALAARLILGWSWSLSALFGALVIVTGPTVITPLLRRIRVTHKVSTVLEAEGVLGDAVGAVVAVVVLEVVISPSFQSFARGPLDLLTRFGTGLGIGVLGGAVIALLLRRRHVIPEGLENVLSLAMAVLVYQASEAFVGESGVVAVTAAGFVVGNQETHALDDLKEFKEQLTLMLIGLLFVLLAADIRLAEVQALGWPGIYTVLALMLIVRPLNVIAGTYGSGLAVREKAFLAWLAPRGIVAAAISSLFAQSLDEAGIPGGGDLRALVFLVIAITVSVQGLTGGLVARLLKVSRPSRQGYVILGANDLARVIARGLSRGGQEVVLLDSNPDACRAAQAEGLRVLHGSGLNEGILLRAGLDGRAGALAVTPNDEANLLFARSARQNFRIESVWVGLRRGHLSVSEDMVHKIGARLLFGRRRHTDLWTLRLERGLATREVWQVSASDTEAPPLEEVLSLLPLLVRRGGALRPMDEQFRLRPGDEVELLIFEEKRESAQEWLRGQSWQPVKEPPAQ